MKRIFSGVTETDEIAPVELFRIGIPNNKTWIIKEIRTCSDHFGNCVLIIYVNGQILWQMAVEFFPSSIHINEQFPAGTEFLFVANMYSVDDTITSATIVVDEV